MSRYIGGIIHPTARYRTQTNTQSRGVWDMKEQYHHKANNNWDTPVSIFPDNAGRRMPVTLITVAAGSADNTDAYSVHQEEFDTAAASSTTGRLYFAIKTTASTPFLNDFCIAGVQITSDDFTTLDHEFYFNSLSDYTSWERATVTGFNTSSAGFENYTDIIGAPSQSFVANTNGAANARISRASSTGSSGTGAADGIALIGLPLSGGTTTIPQSAGTFFMFTEASGTQSQMRNKWFWTRSPQITLDGNSDKDLSIIYHAASPATTGMEDSADEPLFRWWWAT